MRAHLLVCLQLEKFCHLQRPINDFIAVDLFLCIFRYIVPAGKPTFMIILNQIIDILWQNAQPQEVHEYSS